MNRVDEPPGWGTDSYTAVLLVSNEVHPFPGFVRSLLQTHRKGGTEGVEGVTGNIYLPHQKQHFFF